MRDAPIIDVLSPFLYGHADCLRVTWRNRHAYRTRFTDPYRHARALRVT